MKEKNSKKRKVLLIATSVVLVALISIGTTLAYLSAKTVEKDNIFRAGGGITLEVLEPKYDFLTRPINTEPGKKTVKDPMIQNLTADEPIIVGARVSFFINTTVNDVADNPETTDVDETVVAANDYKQVSYDVFKKYVNLEGLTTVTGSTAYAANGDWHNVTAKVTAANNVNGDLFFVYDKILTQLDGEIGTTNGTSYTSDGTDNTTPIFTGVIPNPNITIMTGGTTTTRDGSNVSNSTGTGEVTGTYGKFNYRIVIDAWGVKASDPTLTGSSTSTDAQKITAAETTLLDKLKVTA